MNPYKPNPDLGKQDFLNLYDSRKRFYLLKAKRKGVKLKESKLDGAIFDVMTVGMDENKKDFLSLSTSFRYIPDGSISKNFLSMFSSENLWCGARINYDRKK